MERSHLPHDPLALFDRWLNDAMQHEAIKEPTAMSLATANADGAVSCRIVLLKEFTSEGFIFYTNHATSRKSLDITSNPHAALCFYWMPLDRQVRVEGRVHKVSDERADTYFASRARGSQIGAWASAQSETLESREALEQRLIALEQQYAGREVPRPPHWHGWCVQPERMEFWQQRDYRLHDRFVYVRAEDGQDWAITRLNP